MNEAILKGKWTEIKANLQKTWGKITDDEFEKTKGDVKEIGGLIQQRYGEAQESYQKKLNDILKDFSDKKNAGVDKLKETLKS